MPGNWSALEEVLGYQMRVRERVLRHTKISESNYKVGRASWLAFKHEAMHPESFLYMLLESKRVMPPLGSLFRTSSPCLRRPAKTVWLTSGTGCLPAPPHLAWMILRTNGRPGDLPLWNLKDKQGQFCTVNMPNS